MAVSLSLTDLPRLKEISLGVESFEFCEEFVLERRRCWFLTDRSSIP